MKGLNKTTYNERMRKCRFIMKEMEAILDEGFINNLIYDGSLTLDVCYGTVTFNMVWEEVE